MNYYFRVFIHAIIKRINILSGYRIWSKDDIPEINEEKPDFFRKKELVSILVKLCHVDTWEGVHHRSARGIFNSYAQRIIEREKDMLWIAFNLGMAFELVLLVIYVLIRHAI